MGRLVYRIPGEEVVEQFGTWKLTTLNQLEEDDFIVSTFNKDEIFVFVEGENSREYTYAKHGPFSISKEEYVDALSAFMQEFEQEGVAKAIFSRVHQVERAGLELDTAFNRLCEKYPNAFVYLISGKEIGTWMGATPETLLSSVGDQFYTMSLAGTKKLETTKWTQKEVEEQAFVTDFIIDKLKDVGVTNLLSDGPKDTFTGAVYHLKTDITFRSSFEKLQSLIEELHPTPAVCGVPTNKALNLIAKHEKHARDFYAGVIGRIGASRTDLFVNLRCMQVFEDFLALYVGGGITKDSVVEDEYQETLNKAQTLLSVLH